ncbi:MAG: plasmid recombination protein [Eubacteriales bacterium]|nr:plasmid recombination protein [Eubacteriales bacterium]
MAVTIATHNGSSVSREHNIRNRRVTNPQEHIDPNGQYEIWRDEKARDAYRRIFGEALENYNARQTRDDRKIKDYYTHIEKDDKKHSVYEMIIGIYGKDENGQPICPTDMGKKIMKQFVNSWASRNPNLEMIGAYYHADEPGEPHVHIDYIPVAHGYTRGLETQNGLVKALGEMGFEKKGKATAQIQWEARENKYLDRLCRRHGLEVIHPEVGKGVAHLHTDTFKAQQDRDAALQEMEQANADRLAVLRQLDDNKIKLDMQTEINRAAERFAAETYEPRDLVIKRTPAKRTLLGKEEPATVTIREEHFNALANIHEIAQRALAAAEYIRLSEECMKDHAKMIHCNRIDAHEVSVDERVKQAEHLRDQAVEQIAAYKQREQQNRNHLQQIQEENHSLKNELQEFHDVLDFFPTNWENMKQRTARARKLEKLYYAYKDGLTHSDISYNQWTGSYRFDIDHDGKYADLRQLLIEYKQECDEQNIAHDGEMYERAKQMEKQHRQQEHEWER